MNWAAWGLLVLVVFPLLQVPLIVYLSRHIETDEELPPAVGYGYALDAQSDLDTDRERSSVPDAHPSARSLAHVATRTCPRCGVANDPLFTFCRDCVTRL